MSQSEAGEGRVYYLPFFMAFYGRCVELTQWQNQALGSQAPKCRDVLKVQMGKALQL
jgi:hypothetical protein